MLDSKLGRGPALGGEVMVELVVLGAAFVAAGILGIGLTADGIGIPLIDSRRRLLNPGPGWNVRTTRSSPTP